MLFPSLEGFSTVFVIHTVKGFNVVREAEVDLLEFSSFFYVPTDVGNLISGSVFSKPSWYIWKFLVQILLKPNLKDFEHNLLACEISTILG